MNTRRKILRGILFAIWGDSYMSWAEEQGHGSMHIRTLDDLPAPPISAIRLAKDFANVLTTLNRTTLDELYDRACKAEGCNVDAEELGYYLAMQGRGHGVGWTDKHEKFDVLLPSAEWYALETRTHWTVEGYASPRFASGL